MNEHINRSDDLDQTMREQLNGEIPTESTERMKESLAQFRSDLDEHPYIRQMDKRAARHLSPWRRGVRYALATILLALVVASFSETARSAIGKAVRSRTYFLVDALSRMRQRGDVEEYNKIMEMKDDMPAPDVTTAVVERFLGLTVDGSKAVLELQASQKIPIPESSNDEIDDTIVLRNNSLWAVDLSTGQAAPIAREKALSSCYYLAYDKSRKLQSMLYFTRPESWKMSTDERGGFADRTPDQLWYCDFKNDPVLIEDRHAAGRWFSISPDGSKAIYNLVGEGSMTTVIHDLATGEKTTWPEGAPGQAIDKKKGESAVAIGWTSDSQRIVTMVHRGVDGGVPLCRLEVVSLDGQTVHDSLDIFDNRGYLNDPMFSGSNHLYIQTRAPEYFTESHEDTTNFYSIEPLKRIAVEIGLPLGFTPDGRRCLVQGVKRNGGFKPNLIVFDTETQETVELRLSALDPAISTIGPSKSLYVFDAPTSISPDSRFLNVLPNHSRGTDLQFALLEFDTQSIAKVFRDFRPNVAAWSPDCRRIAARANEPKYPANEYRGGYIVEVETGEITVLDLPHMRPAGWLDSDRVVWYNRWLGSQLEDGLPLQIAISDLSTGEAEVLDLKN